ASLRQTREQRQVRRLLPAETATSTATPKPSAPSTIAVVRRTIRPLRVRRSGCGSANLGTCVHGSSTNCLGIEQRFGLRLCFFELGFLLGGFFYVFGLREFGRFF